MKMSLSWGWPYLILVACTTIHSVSSQCRNDQRSLLLELRNSLDYIHELSTKLVGWNESKECCHWGGVECNRSTGQVIGLDLSEEAITSRIDNLSSLFNLQYLQHLNLAYNPFLGNIPPAFGNFSRLTYLNLSHTGFTGQVPFEISKLVNLVTLDLSMTKYGDDDPFAFSDLQIKSPNLSVIMQNLTSVKELYLGGIDFSADGNTWGEALSSLSSLQVLSMPNCNLRDGFSPFLANLSSVSVLDFDQNNSTSASVPEFFASFTNLTTLNLYNCSLTGTFPQQIFQAPSLQTLELGYNPNLGGTLPSSFSKSLVTLYLFECNFQGTIPPSLGSLNQLEDLDLSFNNFSGSIPSFFPAKNLEFLDLFQNSLTGSIPETFLPKDSKMRLLALGGNNLEGPVPKTVFQLRDLEVLVLSFNRFNDTLQLGDILLALEKLETLDLSYNSLSVDATGIDASASFPYLTDLNLASCNLKTLPEFLRNQPYFYELDLSNNQIEGRIPRWIWYDDLYLLNLSCNSFVEMEQPPSPFPYNLHILDLHSNKIQGQLPDLPSKTALEYFDMSNNSFMTWINPGLGSSLSSAQFISVARNKIHGIIPTSFCNTSKLLVLDLSYNHLNGTIPGCLVAMPQSLAVLNLRGNALHGAIPDEFAKTCTLETINFNMNNLDGRIPGSIGNCKELKVLDLGVNQFRDMFPCHLKGLANLQVLVLRSNQFHGAVICPGSDSFLPLLQIIDLASNQFSGHLSTLFRGRHGMAETSKTQSSLRYLHYQNNYSQAYYQDDVTVILKNNVFEMHKILTIFTSIDLSSNAFHGDLPRDLGNVTALKVLNLSHNALTGKIPSTIGILKQLESLDLCYNQLTGSIPQQLSSLNFLGYLNLSFNNLAGIIPTSTQLQSFNASSYEGNVGLYGPPLTANEGSSQLKPPTSEVGSQRSSRRELEWMISGAAVGFSSGIIIFFGPLVCIKRCREWYNYHADRLIMKILPTEESQWRRRRNASRKQTQ